MMFDKWMLPTLEKIITLSFQAPSLSTKIVVAFSWVIKPVLLDRTIAHRVVGDELGKHCF